MRTVTLSFLRPGQEIVGLDAVYRAPKGQDVDLSTAMAAVMVALSRAPARAARESGKTRLR